MNQNKLIETVSKIYIASHFGIIILLVFLNIIGWFEDNFLKVALSILSPLFATYTTMIIKYIIKNRNNNHTSNQNVNKLFKFITLFITSVFIFFIILIVVLQSVKPVSSENFSMYLGLCESIFGVYVGFILKSLFDNDNQTMPNNL